MRAAHAFVGVARSAITTTALSVTTDVFGLICLYGFGTDILAQGLVISRALAIVALRRSALLITATPTTSALTLSLVCCTGIGFRCITRRTTLIFAIASDLIINFDGIAVTIIAVAVIAITVIAATAAATILAGIAILSALT